MIIIIIIIRIITIIIILLSVSKFIYCILFIYSNLLMLSQNSFSVFWGEETWCWSRLLHNLERFAFNPAGKPLCSYGDPAYPLRIRLQGPFKFGVLTPQMEQYNKAMSAVKSSVEWLFGDVVNSFKFLDFKKKLKLMLSSIGKMYVVSVLLRSVLTCLYGNETSHYFDLSPPSLQEYFS